VGALLVPVMHPGSSRVAPRSPGPHFGAMTRTTSILAAEGVVQWHVGAMCHRPRFCRRQSGNAAERTSANSPSDGATYGKAAMLFLS
jgi:hypothetical protein